MKRILMALTTALVVAASMPAVAQQGGNRDRNGGEQSGRRAIDPRVAALFARYPNGGDGLTSALSALLSTNPELADDVRQAELTANAAQVTAANQALSLSSFASNDDGGSRRGRDFGAFSTGGNNNGGGGVVSPR